MMTPWRRELRDKRLDEARLVELGGLGLVRLAPTFRARGVVRADAAASCFATSRASITCSAGISGTPCCST
jgi:hypothetical protein